MDAPDDRYFSMSIASFGSSTIPLVTRERAVRITNQISDIEGASRTATKYERYSNKATPVSDIPGSTSRPLTRTRNTTDNTLNVDDIEGARARVTDKMNMTRRRVNPLSPDYDLPSFEPAKPYEPKFLRETMDFSDIEGSKTRPLLRVAPRDNTNRTDDILGSSSSYRSRSDQLRHDREPKDIMCTEDISRRNRFVDKTDRKTDLMNPIYEVNGMLSFDDPRYTKPKKAKPYFRESALLRTDDLNARPDPAPPRREYGRTNYLADIAGSEPDSIKHSITTKRITNPLMPVYQSLDDGEVFPPVIKPLMPFNMITTPTLRPKQMIQQQIVGGDASQQSLIETIRTSRRDSAGDDINSEMKMKDRAVTGYNESKNAEHSADMEEDPVVFTTENDQQLQVPPQSTHRYKLDLDIHHGNGSSRPPYSSRQISLNASGTGTGNGTYNDTGAFGTGRFSSGRFPSGRIGMENVPSTFASSSGRNNYPDSSRIPTPYTGHLTVGNKCTGRNAVMSAGEKRAQRERQEEIKSVRDL